MSVVGRAYVTVRAVTREVEGDIKRGLDKALKDVDTKQSGSKLGDDLGAGISEGLDKSLKDSDVGGTGAKVGDDLGAGINKGVKDSKVDEQINKTVKDTDVKKSGGDVGTQLGQAIGDSLFGDGKIKLAFKRVTDKMDGDADRDGESIGAKLGNGIGKGLTKIVMNPAFLMGSVLLPALQDAGGAVEGLSAASVALAQTLGPTLAAGVGVGIGAMTTMGTAIGTVTLALKTQTPALDSFKASLRPVRDEFRGIGEDVQRVLLPALSNAATRVTSALGPSLRDGMVATGQAIGGIAQEFARLSETANFQRDLGELFKSNAVALRDFGAAGVATTGIVIELGSAAGPVTERFAAWARAMTDVGAAKLEALDRSGELESFFNRAGDTAAKWGDALGSVGKGLLNVFSLGATEGQRLLGSLTRITAKFEEWTESARGQESILEWFSSSGPVVSALGNAVGGVAEGLREFSGGADRAASSLDAIGRIAPDLGRGLGGFTTSLSQLLGALEPVAREFGDLGPALSSAFGKIFAEVTPAIRDLAPQLGDLAQAGIRLAEAFAPTIGVMANVAGVASRILAPAATGVATALNALPDAVPGVIGSLVLLRIAFAKMSASTTIGPKITAYKAQMATLQASNVAAGASFSRLRAGASTALSALGGGWGIALGAAAIGLGVFATKQAEAKARVDELAASLDSQTGAITKNTRELVAKGLEDAGAFQAADKLGISLDTVTDAALGNSKAMSEVRGATARAQEQYNASTTNLVTGARNASNATAEQADAGRDLQGALDGMAKDTNSAASSADRLRRGVRGSAEATNEASSSSQRGARGFREYGAAAAVGAGQARGLARAILSVNAASIKAMQGQIGLEQAIDDASKEMKEGAKTLNIHTQAGRDNKSALIGIAVAAGQVTGSARRQDAAMDRARNKIIAMANTMDGVSKGEAVRIANALINVQRRVDGVPNFKKINITTPGSAQAEANINRIQADLNNLRDKTVTLHTVIQTSYVGKRQGIDTALDRADGGWINGPGGSRTDSIAYGSARVSTREFVVNAASARANASLVEAINRSKEPLAVGGTTIVNNYSVLVTNPMVERTSDSIPRALRRARDLGLS